MRPFYFLFSVLQLFSISQIAFAAPVLHETQLYTKTTWDCVAVDPKTWSHPTQKIMQRASVRVEKIQLCNAGKYPIYTVSFNYDPNGATTDYFNKLYAQMASANGFWPFSFVDTQDNLIINVLVMRHHQITIDYQDYAPAK